jgi:thioester reductase-like protein
MKTVFLTGGTGLVGSYLLKILLENKYQVYVLARSKDSHSARDRVVDSLKFWDDVVVDNNSLKNLKVIEGDIVYPDLGIKSKKDIEALISEAEIIFHSAAVVELRTPLDMIRRINVEGTRNVLDFALLCQKRGKLKKINHISTAYVVGAKNRIQFSEDMLELGQGFHNTYEQTKYEAEVLAKEYLNKDLNISIFRPGMVMGDSKEGKTNNFRLFYQPLHFFSKEIYDVFPVDPECIHNLINVDTVARAIFLLGERKEQRVYNITSPKDAAIPYCLGLAAKYFGFKLPKFISLEEFALEKLTPAQKALSEPYIPYFNSTIVFQSQKTQDTLKEYGFKYPAIDEKNILINFAYCDKKGFIKRRKNEYSKVN